MLLIPVFAAGQIRVNKIEQGFNAGNRDGIIYALPGWQIFGNAPKALIERFGPLDPKVSTEMSQIVYQGVPIEPLLLMIAITALFLFLAGRIWQEVEA